MELNLTPPIRKKLIIKKILNTPLIRKFLTSKYRYAKGILYFNRELVNHKYWTNDINRFGYPKELFVSNDTSHMDIVKAIIKSGICDVPAAKLDEFEGELMAQKVIEDNYINESWYGLPLKLF